MPSLPNLPYYPSTLIIPFTYHVGFTALANGASAQTTLTMSADASFELLAILGNSDQDAAATLRPNNFSLQITDQSTGRQLSNARIPQSSYISSSYLSFFTEKYPIRFPASCVLLFDVLNLTAQSSAISIDLKGYKLYQTG